MYFIAVQLKNNNKKIHTHTDTTNKIQALLRFAKMTNNKQRHNNTSKKQLLENNFTYIKKQHTSNKCLHKKKIHHKINHLNKTLYKIVINTFTQQFKMISCV